MKISITQLLIFFMILFSSCKKDEAEYAIPKPQIADIAFSLYDLKLPTDSASTDISFPTTLLLKSDYTWTLDLNGAKSNGIYTWNSTESNKAQIKFTVQQWTGLSSNILISSKIRTVLETVTICAFPDPSFTSIVFIESTFTTNFRASKK